MIDLNVFEFFEIKSTFFEISNPKKINIITEWIYKYPNMNINELIMISLISLMINFSKKIKSYFS